MRRRYTLHDLPGDESSWPIYPPPGSGEPNRWASVPARSIPEEGFEPRDEVGENARGETDYMDWLLRTIEARIEEDQRKQALSREIEERARRDPCHYSHLGPRGPRNHPSVDELAIMSKGRRYYYTHREQELTRQRVYRARRRLEDQDDE